MKDLDTGKVQLASTSDKGVRANGDELPPGAVRERQRVAFVSSATNLDPADTDTGFDMYVKDLVTGDISLVTTSSDGVKATGRGGLRAPEHLGHGELGGVRFDGTNLDPGDTDDVDDVYVKQPIVCTTVGTRGRRRPDGHLGRRRDLRARGRRHHPGPGGDDTLFGEGGLRHAAGRAGRGRAWTAERTATCSTTPARAPACPWTSRPGPRPAGTPRATSSPASRRCQGSDFPDTLTGDGGLNALVGLGRRRRPGGRRRRRPAAGRRRLRHPRLPDLAGRGHRRPGGRHARAAATPTGTASSGFEGVTGSAFDDTLTGRPRRQRLPGHGRRRHHRRGGRDRPCRPTRSRRRPSR